MIFTIKGVLAFMAASISFAPFFISQTTTWLSIFVLIVIAEVFREGARMKEEAELTV